MHFDQSDRERISKRNAGLLASGLVFAPWLWLAAVAVPRFTGNNGLFYCLPLTTPLLLWVITVALIGGAEPEVFRAGAAAPPVRFFRLALKCGLAAIAMRCFLALAGTPEALASGSLWTGTVSPPLFQLTFLSILWDAIFGAQWLALLVGIAALFRGFLMRGRVGAGVVNPEHPQALEVVARVGSLVAFLWWGYWLLECIGAFWSGSELRGGALLDLCLASGVSLALTSMAMPPAAWPGQVAGRGWRGFAIILGAAAVAARWDIYWASGQYAPMGWPDLGAGVEFLVVGVVAVIGAWVGATAWLAVLVERLSV